MKKILYSILFVISALGAQAQSRKQAANFAQFGQYFNPAFTGHEGSALKSFYRNQWTGFENAPRTLFVSAELDLADLVAWRQNTPVTKRSVLGAKNAFGLALLHDTFGPYRENQLLLSYSSQVQLSEKLSLRAGAAATYTGAYLDYNSLTIDQANDPEFQDLILSDNRKINKVDVNIGVMLAAEDYYLGYALQDAAQGKLTTKNNNLNSSFPIQHHVQAGYRKAFNELFGLIVNGIYRYDTKLKETLEGQVKGVYNNTFWVGMGYRKDLAYTFSAGVRLNKLKLGYTYETTTQNARRVTAGSNELVLTYHIGALFNDADGQKLTIW